MLTPRYLLTGREFDIDHLGCETNPPGRSPRIAGRDRGSGHRSTQEPAPHDRRSGGVNLDEISDAQLGEFKSAVTRCLTPHASAVLLDPEFGGSAFDQRADGCGFLMPPMKPTATKTHGPSACSRSCRTCRCAASDLGADGIKILLSYTPFDDPLPTRRKCAMIERIGHECEALDMPFFLEPVGYDPDGIEPKSINMPAQAGGRDPQHGGILQGAVQGGRAQGRVSGERRVRGRQRGLCRQARVLTEPKRWSTTGSADAVARRPYIYLSAGRQQRTFPRIAAAGF
jgi:hypothetical protein